ncbi:zinc transporter ZupT [Eubacteriales bacterium mix99]|jgi:ZIP family zinc transporter|nr:zinc transporter ZupT [Clostridiales bacterium]
MDPKVLTALMMSLFAGLATGIGGAIAFFAKRTNKKFLSVAMGFSAGVMIYISFVELFSQAQDALTAELGTKPGSWVTAASFFGGMLIIALIDKLVPEAENPHEVHTVEDIHEAEDAHEAEVAQEAQGSPVQESEEEKENKLMRAGLLTALAIAIHNFPEGFASFMSALRDPSVGIGIAIAIAIHNIPEGISVSMPVYYATGSRSKAFVYSFLSGLTEPIGALLGYLILAQFMSETLFGIVFAAIAGIMVYISFDQLLPTAEEYGEHHLAIYGLISGMIVMAISLLLF